MTTPSSHDQPAILDPHALLAADAVVERMASGCGWSEGPLWMPESRVLRWSDIHGDRILEVDEAGVARVHRERVEFTNARIAARGGVVQCSHGRRALELERDGVVTVLVDRFGEHRLNSPNDLVEHPDGSIWFTDPPYGIEQPKEGYPGEREYGGCFVFRWSERDGIHPVVTDMAKPNGIAFSPDRRVLYVTESAGPEDTDEVATIRAYRLEGEGADARAIEGRRLARIEGGTPDGIAVDVAGRVWSSSGDGVHVLAPSGERLAFVPVPEVVANVTFGDDGWLWMTATTSVYRVRTTTRPA
ncbi:SMP-30/gluconolactonase/LRE family protein [Agrococcus sp. SGAir0287]|uniref:SMP-30/gluconolactonase/LRE family protein n=1 Tax=Agrococcus sp. SGAir0287 TaxID=2070347 RepID=UPI0010CD070F|nr:SMP-30/gluconolactonase/LRE family protein [Agrococcus sp. SGAir0287]QCR18701.1 gluconolactonase [Agrococcus sp. SGAir0287]